MNNRIGSVENDKSAPALDAEVLETLLNVGGADLRGPLCAQLTADFIRLNGLIGVETGTDLARAAHEIKGLAATIGAGRLSQMARTLDSVAATLPDAARDAMVTAMQAEVSTTLEVLKKAAQGQPYS